MKPFVNFRTVLIALCAVCQMGAWVSQTNAQVTGYMGKRFLVKTDLLTPIRQRGFSLGLEAVAFKRISFTADFIRTSTRHPYDHGMSAYNQSHRDFSQYTTLKDEKAKMIAYGWRFGLRRYLSTSIYAPLGVYVEYAYGFGRGSLHGQHVVYGWGPSPSNPETFTQQPLGAVDYVLSNVHYRDFIGGFGVQRVIRDRLAIDVMLSINYRESWISNPTDTFFDGKETNEYRILLEQHKRMSGSNVVTLFSGVDSPVILPFQEEKYRGLTGIGIHARLQIGYLLF